MTDPIVEALDGFVPAFDSARGNWQAILSAASLPVPVEAADIQPRVAPRRAVFARRTVQVLIAIAVLAVITTGIAWAAGAFKQTPREFSRLIRPGA